MKKRIESIVGGTDTWSDEIEEVRMVYIRGKSDLPGSNLGQKILPRSENITREVLGKSWKLKGLTGCEKI